MNKIYKVYYQTCEDDVIEAFFSTREKAELYKELCGSFYKIQEAELDSEIPEPVEKTWKCLITLDGEVKGAMPVFESEIIENEFIKDAIQFQILPLGEKCIAMCFNCTTLSEAKCIALGRLEEIKKSSKFPYLRKQVLLYSFDYPTYDFNTGDIILTKYDNLNPQINAKIRRI